MSQLNLIREKIRRVKQDDDIEDRKGTQPAKYYAKDADGDEMSKKTKQARARHFEKGAAKDDNDDSAYKPAPGDAEADTKPSKHTKKFKKMFGEDDGCWDTHKKVGMKPKNGKMVPNCVPKEELEENYDGDMALNSLENITRNSQALKKVIRKDGDYPAWWNSKLTKADDYLDVCHDYLMSELAQGRVAEDSLPDITDILEAVDEGKLVGNTGFIIDSLGSLIKQKIGKLMQSNREKGIVMMNNLARIVGASVSQSHKRNNDLYLKSSFINDGEPIVQGESIEEELKNTDKSYIAKRVQMMEKLIDKLIRMKGVDPRDKDAWRKVQQAKFALEDMLEEDVQYEVNEKVDVKKVLKKVKGLTKDQLQVLSQMNPATLVTLSQQLSNLVMGEKLDKDSDAGDYIDDFRKSDAPQFKGKSDKKIRDMAIAAYLSRKGK